MITDQQRAIEVLEVLYGDGAYEITKAMTKEEKAHRTQAQVGLASNVVGLAAGAAGTKEAYGAFQAARREKKGYVPGKTVGKPAKPWKIKLNRASARYAVPAAGAALGLQVANIAGDAVANRVLARGAKKKEVHKAEKTPTDLKAGKYKLAKKGVNLAGAGAKKAPEVGQKAFAAAQQIPELSQKTALATSNYAKTTTDYTKAKVATVKKNLDLTIRGEVSKMNTDLQQVFGWASVIELNGEPVIDLQGDLMTIETIEKAAYDYVHKSRKGGRQHQRNGEEPLHVSDMIESFVLTPEKKEQMGLPATTPTGWWVGFQINDDDTWAAYKDGKLKEFSIHGSGTRRAMEV